jgi:nitrogen regulatory protein PII
MFIMFTKQIKLKMPFRFRLKHSYAILFTFIVMVFIVSCTREKSLGNFTVYTPEGWTRVETIGRNNQKKVLFTAPIKEYNDSFIENISVDIVNYDDLDTYVSKVLEEVKKTATSYKEQKRVKCIINGYDSRWVQAEIIFNNDSDDTVKEQKTYFIKEKDKRNIYMIVCSAKRYSISIIQNKIDEVLNSFHIIPEIK